MEGRNPLENQAPEHLAPLAEELAARQPRRTENAYPFGYEQLSQLFDSPAAPDLVAVHTAAHNWEDQGGHIGEHGSIDVVQARAPFVLAGAGVRAQGMLPRSCRLVDVAPTLAALMGVAPTGGWGHNGAARDDVRLARQDGEVLEDLIAEDERPRHVVGFLLDGANANVLYDMAARGEAPNLARLMEMGTTYAHGAMSSCPTVTLANHTSILTGAYPGHHGILHNAWWDRFEQEQVITNSPIHWVTAMETLEPGVETLFHAVHRTWPDAVTVAIDEPCDSGADYSTLGLMRQGEVLPRTPHDLPHSTERFVRPVKEYGWSSKVDHIGVEQFCGIWGEGPYRGVDWPIPHFTWVNFVLTDAAFHEGGPYSEIAAASVHDTDGRLGEILEAVERAGVWDQTAFFVVADHGMEETDSSCTGNWADALDADRPRLPRRGLRLHLRQPLRRASPAARMGSRPSSTRPLDQPGQGSPAPTGRAGLPCGRSLLRIVEHPSATESLRVVEKAVRVVECVAHPASGIDLRHPCREAHLDLDTAVLAGADLERALPQPLQGALERLAGLAGLGGREERGELVAAPTRHRVCCTKLGGEQAAGLHEHCVAHHVAALVHLLEVVEVDECERERVPGAAAQLGQALEGVGEGPPVRQPREGVRAGQLLCMLLGVVDLGAPPVDLGDVTSGADHDLRAAVEEAGPADPEVVAVVVAGSALRDEPVLPAIPASLGLVRHRSPVGRVHEIEQVGSLELLGAPTERPLPRRVQQQRAAVEVHDAEQIRAVLDQVPGQGSVIPRSQLSRTHRGAFHRSPIRTQFRSVGILRS